jgi:adenylate cyclase
VSEIFVSYSRSTEPEAQAVTAALRALGYSVWRDDELPAHRPYAEVIEERLRAAKAVVVLWSAEAVKSQWVRAEADLAREAGSLVQLRIDATPLPLPFNQIQCADLTAALADGALDPEEFGWRTIVASVAALVQGAVSPARAPDPVARQGVSICVLPFANMSADPEQEYFSDGISEDIITDLGKVSALSVVSRNSAFQFKGRHVDARQIARQLDVSHLLEGSVRKAGARVRITAQLIDAAADSHIWAERWDRELTDIFAVQDEISRAIVTALKVKLAPEEKAAIEQRGTGAADAYDLYLMARRHWLSGNTDLAGHETIVSLCRRALKVDPDYAQAWALMAQAQFSLYARFGRASEDGEASADRALALAPDLAEPHIVKARYLRRRGRLAESEAELETALRLGPDSFEVYAAAAHMRFLEQRVAEAAVFYERAATLAETSFQPAEMLVSCYSALGDAEGVRRAGRMSLERAELALAQDPSNGRALSAGASGLAAMGERERALEWIARALRIDPDNRPMVYNLACALSAFLGDTDGALAMLTPYLATATSSELLHMTADPDINPLREDARFQALFAEAQARTGAA